MYNYEGGAPTGYLGLAEITKKSKATTVCCR